MERARRTVLRTLVGTVTVATAGLAGCSGSDGRGGETETTSTTTSAGNGGTTTTPADSGGTTTVVEMTDDLDFVPDRVEVSVGDTVRWTNVGVVAHSVTAYEDDVPSDAAYFASGGFDSESAANRAYPEGGIGEDGSYEHTFEVAGTYEYFCIPHESAGMTGTVVVAE
ncbi:MAG: plastocyanin/azurin family copper-binding protein [Halobacteriaceae archaeon]